MEKNQVYQDLEAFLHYPRSRLFCLEPAGLKTKLREGLISFIIRLAEAHCLPVGILMEREIAPILARMHGGGNLHKIYNHTAALNSTGVMASSLACALEELTGQENLELLTLVPLSELLTSRNLLRRNRSWCPLCYENWCKTKQTVYEPLLWSLVIVKVCPLHCCVLSEICPHCDQTNLPLAWHSRSGYCSKCQHWLGSSFANLPKNFEELSESELGVLVWIANSVGDLLASTPNLTSPITNVSLAQAFRAHVNIASNGNIAEFARQLQLPRNTVWLWCNGRNLPQLDTWVQICYRLNRSLLEFLTQQPEQGTSIGPAKTLLSFQTKPKAEARAIDTNALEDQLEEVFLDHKCPPLPMEQVARQMGIHRKTIFRLFPEVCRAISAKYDSFQKARHRREVEQSREEVKQAVLKLHKAGLHPSEGRVAQMMNRPGYLRYKQVRAAIAEAKLELSAQVQDSGSK